MTKPTKKPTAKKAKTTVRIGKGAAPAKPARKKAAKATRARDGASPKKAPEAPRPSPQPERIVLAKPFSLEISQDITDRCQELLRERETLAKLKVQRTELKKARAANDVDLQETVQDENDEGRGIKAKDGGLHATIDHAEHEVLVAARTWLTAEKQANNDDKQVVTELASALGRVERLMEKCELRMEESAAGATRPAPRPTKASPTPTSNGSPKGSTQNGTKPSAKPEPEPEDKSGIPKGWHVMPWAEISGRGLVDPADATEAGELPERWTSPRAALLHIQEAAQNGGRPFDGHDRWAIGRALNAIADLQKARPAENIADLLSSIAETASDLLTTAIQKHSAKLADTLEELQAA